MLAYVLLMTLSAATPIDFVPFTLADLIDPATRLTCQTDTSLRIEHAGVTYFDGPAHVLLDTLNATEALYNTQGQSLRRADNPDILQLFHDAAALQSQAVAGLRIRLAGATFIQPALRDCPQVTLADLGINPRRGAPYQDTDALSLTGGVVLPTADWLMRINDEQRMLCAIGASLFADGSLPQEVDGIMDRRTATLERLGLSSFHPVFSMQTMPRLRTAAQIADDVHAATVLRSTPRQQILAVAADAVAANSPATGPATPTGTPAAAALQTDTAAGTTPRAPPTLHKRKEWQGFTLGQRNRFAVSADASVDVRGSATEQGLRVQGQAHVVVMGHDMQVLQGQADIATSAQRLHGEAWLRSMGHDIARRQFDTQDSYEVSDVELAAYGFDVSTSQSFMIGAIPVSVGAGTRGKARLTWDVGAAPQQAEASVHPHVRADAYVSGGVGPAAFGSAGAEGSVLLLAFGPVLQARSRVAYDDNAAVVVSGSINAEAQYDALSGALSAFVELPLPTAGWPPFAPKRCHAQIFKWPGFHGAPKIMNWGMQVTPLTVQLYGDLLDQTDWHEMRTLQASQQLQARAQALAAAGTHVTQREQTVLTAIAADLAEPAQQTFNVDTVKLLQKADTALLQQRDYLTTLRRWVTF